MQSLNTRDGHKKDNFRLSDHLIRSNLSPWQQILNHGWWSLHLKGSCKLSASPSVYLSPQQITYRSIMVDSLVLQGLCLTIFPEILSQSFLQFLCYDSAVNASDVYLPKSADGRCQLQSKTFPILTDCFLFKFLISLHNERINQSSS